MRCAAAASLQNICGAYEGSGVVGHLIPSRQVFNATLGEHQLVPGVHVGNSSVASADQGYDTVLSWLQSHGLRQKAREYQKAKLVLSNPNALHMQKMLADPPKSHTEWRYMLLYNVKEGVLIYLGEDRESCEKVVRDVAVMYGITTHPPGRTSLVTGTSIAGEGHHRNGDRDAADEQRSAARIRQDAEDRVKSVDIPVGKVNKGTACFKVSTIIIQELGRRFAIHCDPEEQSEHTNCIMFCMRVILELKLTLRGYHIRRLCEEHAFLGKKAGDAVSSAWEQLWGRTGANTNAGLDSQEAKLNCHITSSRWRDALSTTKEEPHRLLHAWRGLPRRTTTAFTPTPAAAT